MRIGTVSLASDATCLECGYSFRGLTEMRCPECGREFDIEDPRTYATPRAASRLRAFLHRHRRIRAALALVTCVLTSGALYYSQSWSLFFWVPALYLMFRKRWPSTVVFLLATPVAYFTFESCWAYMHGSSWYVRPQYSIVQTPQGNLDAVTRIRGFDPGCGTRSANAWVASLGRDVAAVLMSALVGPPPGAYTGPYPNEDECRQLLASAGQAQPRGNLENGIIVVGKLRLSVDPDHVNGWGFVDNTHDGSAPVAAIFKSKCLVLRIPRDLDPPLSTVYLFDIATGRAFAVYWDQSPKTTNQLSPP